MLLPPAHLFEKRWGQKLFRKALRAISVLGTVLSSSKVLIKLFQKFGPRQGRRRQEMKAEADKAKIYRKTFPMSTNPDKIKKYE